MSKLPVDSVLPELLGQLERRSVCLLQAPPGAGKTTRVPPALLTAGWASGRRIIMLEPRRLAARSAARFMARELGEDVGQTVGYRVRLDTRVSAATRIEVVTEGVLTRMIQDDPTLSDYAAVLFDEFHERSLDADLALALVRESQQALREDLRIVIMSATLQTDALARLLDDAPVVRSEGRQYPVEIRHRPPRKADDSLAGVTATIGHALQTDPGSVLVFLPGIGEIRRIAGRLEGSLPDDVTLAPLYGDLSGPEQDAAIAPAPSGRRKVVLATAIAESSLTIEGVRVVIDAGWQRRSRFDPNSAMTRLVTTRISKSSAEQRSGRAGRLAPGVAYRLWSQGEQVALGASDPPEILQADLTGLVLELARWGAREPGALDWLDAPPRAHWNQAVELLQWLDAVDDKGAITDHGQAMLAAGLHPRLAHLVVRGRESGQARTAARLAALLSERDILLDPPGADLEARLAALDGDSGARVHRGRLRQVRELARSLLKDRARTDDQGPASAGALLALAFPDRIGQRRSGRGRFVLSNGRGAFVFDGDALAGSDYLVAAELDGQAREARIFLAARVERDELERSLAGHVVSQDQARWDDQRGTLSAVRQRRLGALVLEEKPLAAPAPDVIEAGLLDALRRRGLDALLGDPATRQWLARARLAHDRFGPPWPDFSERALHDELEDWLAPYLAGRRYWKDLEALDHRAILAARMGHDRARELDRLLPARLTIPTGRRVAIDYTAEGGPVLAAKLQSLFGWTETPRLADGRVALTIHLLSPAGRPLAITADLASFWSNAYPEVRKDMRGRYPKHPWPEDPLSARPREGTGRE